MAQWFKIPTRAYEGFDTLTELGPDKLDRLLKEVASRELTLDIDALATTLSRALEFDGERIGQAISTVLVPLSGVREAFRMEPDDFVKLLSRLIEKQDHKWHEKNHAAWQTVGPAVGRLIAANGYFSLLHKVFRLVASRPSLVRELRILTELRPVYDDEATAIKAMLLTSTLVIDYEDGTESKRLHLALDQDDLKTLREQLDRADKKAQLLEEQVSQLNVPILVPGTESR